MLLKNIHVHSLYLLRFVYVVVFNVKAAKENVRLVILEWLMQISFAPYQPDWGSDQYIFLRKIFWYFTKTKMSSMPHTGSVASRHIKSIHKKEP